MAGRTLYDKLWDSHLVKQNSDGSSLIYIDRHVLHEAKSFSSSILSIKTDPTMPRQPISPTFFIALTPINF